MNLLQKLHALLVSDDMYVWHFHTKRLGPSFVYWLPKEEPDNEDGYAFHTLEQMIESAYAHIDPLAKPLPESIEPVVEQRSPWGLGALRHLGVSFGRLLTNHG